MPEREIASKLLSSGLTLLGFLVPVFITVLTIGSDPSIGSNYKRTIDLSVLYFVPGVIIISAQILICLLVISGRLLGRNLPLWSTALIVLYLTVGIVVFSLRMVWA